MSRKKGDYFENKAIEFLLSNDFVIIQRNYYARKLGEIDIIATKNNIYHFIEVKSGDRFEAIYNITANKIYKLLRSIDYYLKVKDIDCAYCVDAIIFSNDKIEFLENITM